MVHLDWPACSVNIANLTTELDCFDSFFKKCITKVVLTTPVTNGCFQVFNCVVACKEIVFQRFAKRLSSIPELG